MKKALIIVYHFPPFGGGGVMRTLKYVKYLPDEQVIPYVLTMQHKSLWAKDEPLLKEISPQVKIERIDTFEMSHLVDNMRTFSDGGDISGKTSWIREARSFLLAKLFILLKNLYLPFLPNLFFGWIPSAIRKAGEIIERENIEVIYTTAPPFSTLLIGYYLHKKYKLPWVVDFRDAWVSNPLFFRSIRSLSARISSVFERLVISNAQKVISATQPITNDFLKRYKELPASKFVTITNGFDPEDLNGIDTNSADPKNDKMIIAYLGSTFTSIRTAKYFLLAIKELIAQFPELLTVLNIQLLANLGFEESKLIKEDKKLAMIVDCVGFLPHKEALKYLVNSHVALLIFFEREGGPFIYTGKIFEYLGACKPILATIPNGIAADLIRENNLGQVVSPTNIEEIKKAILSLYDSYRKGKLRSGANQDVVSKYDRRTLTKRLAGVFNEVLGHQNIKVLMQNRVNALEAVGGDTVQMLSLKAELEKHQIYVDISLELEPDLTGYDIVHLFNLVRIHETYIQFRNAQKQGKKVVISPIYWDFSELEENSGQLKYIMRKIIGADGMELFKTIMRIIFDFRQAMALKYLFSKSYSAQQKEIVGKSDIVLPNSLAEAKLIIDMFGKSNVVSVYNGVSIEMFSKGNERRFREKYNVWHDKFVLCVGRFDNRKNQLNLIKALAGTNIPLVFIGDPGLNYGRYYRQCRDAANNNMMFLPAMPQHEIADAMAAAHVHALPSWLETPGLVSLEAAISGCNIVVSTRGSTKEYFRDYVWYCEPNDLLSIKTAIESSLSAEKGSNLNSLKNLIMDKFNWAKAGLETMAAYRSILGDK
jgi:glycosyltransferase involved in cell wall biosynthesis